MFVSGKQLEAEAKDEAVGIKKAVSRLAQKKRDERRAREAKARKGK